MTIDPAAVRTTIAPWLSVRNGAQAVEFYKSAFGAVEVFRMDEGSSVVARLLSKAQSFGWGTSRPNTETSVRRA
jgi:PhnB protein